MISPRLAPFGTTIFSEMTRLALEHGAVNLSQGFPDFPGPAPVIEAAVEALRAGHNQYARSQGHPELVRAITGGIARRYGLLYDAERECAVFSGATEAIASFCQGFLSPGDEVLLLEPVYDSYPACVAMAGAVPRFLTLRYPRFEVDGDALEALVTPRTRLLILNTPHNPTGKVFRREELESIARVARRHGLAVLSDEVYEHLTYGVGHVPIATLEGMRERTLTVSSAGKTFSLTGWKVGWATGPEGLVRAAQAAHQYVTFSTATPLQVAVATALNTCGDEYYRGLRAEFEARRSFLLDTLREVGFQPAEPQGTYFVLAAFEGLHAGDDRSFARELVERVGVAAIPPSVFYPSCPEAGRRLLRFAFVKRLETLEAARVRLQKLRPGS